MRAAAMAASIHLFNVAAVAAVAGQGDQLFSITTDRHRLGVGGLDAFVGKQLVDHRPAQALALILCFVPVYIQLH